MVVECRTLISAKGLDLFIAISTNFCPWSFARTVQTWKNEYLPECSQPTKDCCGVTCSWLLLGVVCSCSRLLLGVVCSCSRLLLGVVWLMPSVCHETDLWVSDPLDEPEYNTWAALVVSTWLSKRNIYFHSLSLPRDHYRIVTHNIIHIQSILITLHIYKYRY